MSILRILSIVALLIPVFGCSRYSSYSEAQLACQNWADQGNEKGGNFWCVDDDISQKRTNIIIGWDHYYDDDKRRVLRRFYY
jgi:hypothetical protein